MDLSKIQAGFIPASGTNLLCARKKALLCCAGYGSSCVTIFAGQESMC